MHCNFTKWKISFSSKKDRWLTFYYNPKRVLLPTRQSLLKMWSGRSWHRDKLHAPETFVNKGCWKQSQFCEAQFSRHVYQTGAFSKPTSSQVQAEVSCYRQAKLFSFLSTTLVARHTLILFIAEQGPTICYGEYAIWKYNSFLFIQPQ